jgi:hypothetical protein
MKYTRPLLLLGALISIGVGDIGISSQLHFSIA